jgi:hypothetical protein
MRRINCNDRVIIDGVKRILDGCGVAGPMRMAYIDLAKKACKTCEETKLSLKEIAMELVRECQRWDIHFFAEHPGINLSLSLPSFFM